jgi:hypothetical protein
LQPHSPRTAVENATLTLEQDLKATPEDPKIWAEYIGVLTYAQRFPEATQAVEDAFASIEASMTVPVQIAEINLQFAMGEYDTVLELSEAALARRGTGRPPVSGGWPHRACGHRRGRVRTHRRPWLLRRILPCGFGRDAIGCR